MMKKLLIFEDDPQLFELLGMILKPKGYMVSHRSDCYDVCEVVKQEMPDLILMDLRIPDVGGAAATQALKREVETRDIPVIILSANAKTKEIATICGADGYIVKPFEVTDLENIINSHLKS